MKILMLTDRMDVGGAETHIAELAHGLCRLGVDVEILSEGGAIADQLERVGIVQHRMPICTHDPVKLLLLRRRLRQLVREEKYDVLHAHARIPAFLLRWLSGERAARVVTVHARFRTSPLLKKLCYWGERTVAVSEDLRRYVCDAYRLSGDSVEVIANGIDCTRFSPRERPEDGKLRILFASRLDDDCARGAVLLCRIAPALCRSHPNLEIGIVGGGNALARIAELADEVNRTVGRYAVRIYGQVSDMSALLATQDIFVGVSRAAMEAAACGCAVVLCGNEGYLGILDQKTEKHAVLCNFCCRGHRRAEAFLLESDLRKLIDDPTCRRRSSAEGRELIRRFFDADQMCRETLELYRRLKPTQVRRKILIGGYFGCGNAGDDAMLMGFLRGMREIDPTIEIRALAARPKKSARRFGIPCIARKNFFAVYRSMKRADAFLCGGGSLLQNKTSERSLRYYLTLLRMSGRVGCKTVLYAAGIGPLDGDRVCRRVARVLDGCDYISLREPDSLRFLAKLGVDRSILHEGADPAMLLTDPSVTRGAALLEEYGVARDRKLLGVVLRHAPDGTAHLWRSVATAVHIVCRRHGMQPILIPFCEEDASATQTAAKNLRASVLCARGVGDLAALLRSCQAVVTMRLHAMVLATLTGTPAIGVVTDPLDGKIPSFSRASGQETIVYPNPSVAELVDTIEQCLSKASAQTSDLVLDAAAEMQKKARKDLANIVEMLYNKEDMTNDR